MFMAAVVVAALLGAPVGPSAPSVVTGPSGSVVDRHGRVYVTEGDTLIRLMPRGRRAVVASFPARLVPAPVRLPDGTPRGVPVPMRPVPSAVVQGPDGAFYVGELTGFPFSPGRARVWRVVPGRPPEVYAGGLTAVVDLAWGPGGLYVLEVARYGLSTGALVRIAGPGRHRVVAARGLTAPSRLTIHGHRAYVTTGGQDGVREIELGSVS